MSLMKMGSLSCTELMLKVNLHLHLKFQLTIHKIGGKQMDFSNENHVLVVFPHSDDEAFSVSGTIMKYVDAGVPVTYACLTFGDMGRNLGYPPVATRESLHTVRKKEVEESALIMGVTDLRLLGFRDKTLEFEDRKSVV